MENAQLAKKNWIIDLIKDAGYGCLATVENGQPRVRPMMPHLDEDGTFYLALLGHSRTIPQIQINPKVELCYIDRKMCFCRIAAHAKVSANLEKKELVWNNIPMLRQYFSSPEDPNYALLEIIPDVIETMTPAQKKPDSVSIQLTQD